MSEDQVDRIEAFVTGCFLLCFGLGVAACVIFGAVKLIVLMWGGAS